MDSAAFHRILKALADPRRFSIFQRISSSSELACQTLGAEIPVSKATLSHHLQELESAGLIAIRKEGKFAYLSFCKPIWDEYCRELKKKIG